MKKAEISKIKRRFLLNIKRIDRLTGDGRNIDDDILRMALVFSHSVFEDTFRQIVIGHIKPLEADWITELPISEEDGNRKTKINLKEIAELPPELTIQELVDNRVKNYMSRISFNSSDEVVKWIKRAGLDAEPIREHLTALDTGIKRRHKIVHEADMSSNRVRKITPKQVVSYISSFGATLVKLIQQMEGSDAKPIDVSKLKSFHTKDD